MLAMQRICFKIEMPSLSNIRNSLKFCDFFVYQGPTIYPYVDRLWPGKKPVLKLTDSSSNNGNYYYSSHIYIIKFKSPFVKGLWVFFLQYDFGILAKYETWHVQILPCCWFDPKIFSLCMVFELSMRKETYYFNFSKVESHLYWSLLVFSV